LVYFGLIDQEDAQCFSVQSSVEEGSFILAAGAVLLALLNTFVTKATTQYFRDIDAVPNTEAAKVYGDDELRPPQIDQDLVIEPAPVLLSDRFRWCLVCPDPKEV
jgi:hypothetical protein